MTQGTRRLYSEDEVKIVENINKAELSKCLGYRARDVDSSGGGREKNKKK